ncbi:MAG: hypothetical protein JNK41_02065 [Saprospiraceae bacterium]|nr:hypothetical protein [Saprospiraceae bacterium]
MGYDAFVTCNCFKEGKTKEPPYKGFMKIDVEGIYLDLDLTYNQDKDEYLKRHQEFDDWKRTACPHQDMRFASEHLANTSGMEAFKTMLQDFGGEKRFPTLTKYLPVSNGGTLPAAYAEKVLKELKDIEQEKTGEKKVILRLNTGEIIWSTNENHSFIFIWTGNNRENYGIDKDGFFIIQNREFLWRRSSTLVFRSKNFKQVVLGKNKFQFIDNPTKKQYKGTTNIHPDGKEQAIQDFDFIVDMEVAPLATEYKYIIEPLKRLINASLETGNPIIWT